MYFMQRGKQEGRSRKWNRQREKAAIRHASDRCRSTWEALTAKMWIIATLEVILGCRNRGTWTRWSNETRMSWGSSNGSQARAEHSGAGPKDQKTLVSRKLRDQSKFSAAKRSRAGEDAAHVARGSEAYQKARPRPSQTLGPLGNKGLRAES